MVNGIWLLAMSGVVLFLRAVPIERSLGTRAVLAIIGAFSFGHSALLNIRWLSDYPVYWATWVASSAIQGVAGSLLTVWAIFAIAGAKLEPLRRFRLPTGIAGAAVGAWMIAAAIIFAVKP